jgi:hypothetical protein
MKQDGEYLLLHQLDHHGCPDRFPHPPFSFSPFRKDLVMKLKHLFTLNLFISISFGISSVFFTSWSLSLYGIPAEPDVIWIGRLAGGSILGFATLMWFGRRSESREARRAIALALLIQYVVGLSASLLIHLEVVRSIFGWSDLLVYGLLALAYAWFLFIKPENI